MTKTKLGFSMFRLAHWLALSGAGFALPLAIINFPALEALPVLAIFLLTVVGLLFCATERQGRRWALLTAAGLLLALVIGPLLFGLSGGYYDKFPILIAFSFLSMSLSWAWWIRYLHVVAESLNLPQQSRRIKRVGLVPVATLVLFLTLMGLFTVTNSTMFSYGWGSQMEWARFATAGLACLALVFIAVDHYRLLGTLLQAMNGSGLTAAAPPLRKIAPAVLPSEPQKVTPVATQLPTSAAAKLEPADRLQLRLRKLAEIHAEGLITAEDYAKKKQELLDSL